MERLTRRLFMWPWQPHFQCIVESGLEQVLKRLAPGLDAQVFLVGSLLEPAEGRFPICIEPEDTWIQPEVFARLSECEEAMLSADPASRLRHTLAAAQAEHDKALRCGIYSDAVRRCLEERDPDGVYLACHPGEVGGYLVTAVVRVPRQGIEHHRKLSKEWVEVNAVRRCPLPTSLVDAALREFLRVCTEGLMLRSPGEYTGYPSVTSDELVRRAGRAFMAPSEWAASSNFGLEMSGSFEDCNAVASLRYEGHEARGRLVIAREGHPCVHEAVRLRRPVHLREFRATRKLLEMSDSEFCLLVADGAVYGLGRPTGDYNANDEDLFVVELTGHHKWQLMHANEVMMTVAYGMPSLPGEPLDSARLADILRRLFPCADGAGIERVCRIVFAATQQRHGTMIVVSADAEAEAERLSGQSTVLQPIALDVPMVRRLSSVDGAILMSPDGTCTAIGVILDGVATHRGTAARGARYNSAVRYVEARRGPDSRYRCAAVVISEDGTVDIVPDLRPRISRAVVRDRLDALERSVSAEEVDLRGYYDAMNWLREHCFYLSQSECDTVNMARERVSAVLRETGELIIVYPAFSPDADMDDSYLMD